MRKRADGFAPPTKSLTENTKGVIHTEPQPGVVWIKHGTQELDMSKDFSIWFEDVLVSHDWDPDQPEVQILMEKHQGYFMSMYAAGSSENEIVRAFAGFWHNRYPGAE